MVSFGRAEEQSDTDALEMEFFLPNKLKMVSEAALIFAASYCSLPWEIALGFRAYSSY